MMKHPFRSAFLGFALMAASFGAFASTFILTEDELDADVFPEVAESIRVNLDGPNAPAGLTPAKKQQVLRSLERIQGFLDAGSEAKDRRVRNEQARLNAALAPSVARNDGKSEVVCRRTKQIGSNIPTTVCRTRAEMEAEEYAAEEELRRLNQLQSMGD